MKNLLICVSGLTPQIITETLFCLSIQKKISIDELYVITTSRGRDVILGMDEFYNKKKPELYPPLYEEIKRMCLKYKIKLPVFAANHIIVASELSIELPDIRNDKHNELFPNVLCDFISKKSKDNYNILHCSISGGRKSMSVDMAFALSLFGRENDKLWHVLTHENEEFKHFFPQNKMQEKDLELAEIPFVKLRSILGNSTSQKSFEKMSYSDIVRFTQNELKKNNAYKLFISNKRREMWYGENERVRIDPKQIDLLKYMVENRKVKVQSLISSFSIDKRTGEPIKRYDEKNIAQLVSKTNSKLKSAINDFSVIELFIIQSGAYGEGEYTISAGSRNVEFLDE